MFVFEEAKRSEVKIKLAVGGPTGSGKTMSSLVLAYGLVKEEHPDWTDAQIWRSIFVIDTENHSASLYRGAVVGNMQIGAFMAGNMSAPYTATAYIDAIHAAENAGAQVLIVDSMSHAWSGDGGALDKQAKIAARTGNSYTAWRDISPEQNQLMNTILQSKCHIISCFRAKQDYVQEKNDKGKTVVRNVGLGFVFQDSAEYEYTTLFYLDNDHIANATKDRTGMFTGKFFEITPDTGRKFYEWLSSGAPAVDNTPKPVMQKAEAVQAPSKQNEEPVPLDNLPPWDEPAAAQTAVPDITIEQLDQQVRLHVASMTVDERRAFGSKVAEIAGTKDYRMVTDKNIILNLYKLCGGK